jgi:hypothetical protein
VLEAAGFLRLYTVRSLGLDSYQPAKQLIGYAAFVVTPHPHCKGSRQALCDALYIADDWRPSQAGTSLIKYCGGQLRSAGVAVCHYTVKPQRDYSIVLRRFGYEPFEVVWAKRLDQGEP